MSLITGRYKTIAGADKQRNVELKHSVKRFLNTNDQKSRL